jgi:mono/diheme cytochrome c family protein
MARAPRRPPVVEPAPRPQPQPQPQPAVAAEAEAAEAEEPETAETSVPETLPLESSDPEAEEKGPKLVAERCSKCHTTRRVYMKVESVETGEAIIERMRHKTGSGISPDDADMIKRFLRARVGKTD